MSRAHNHFLRTDFFAIRRGRPVLQFDSRDYFHLPGIDPCSRQSFEQYGKIRSRGPRNFPKIDTPKLEIARSRCTHAIRPNSPSPPASPRGKEAGVISPNKLCTYAARRCVQKITLAAVFPRPFVAAESSINGEEARCVLLIASTDTYDLDLDSRYARAFIFERRREREEAARREETAAGHGTFTWNG